MSESFSTHANSINMNYCAICLVVFAAACAKPKPFSSASVSDDAGVLARTRDIPVGAQDSGATTKDAGASSIAATDPPAIPEGQSVTPMLRTGPDDAGADVPVSAIGFPAVSEDGKTVAFANSDEDGARGNPNLAITVRGIDNDAVVWTILVQDASFSPEEIGSGSEERKRILARATQANAMLRKTKWLTLVQADPSEDAANGYFDTARSGDLNIAYAEPKLTVTRGGLDAGNTRILDRSFPAWLAKARRECSNPGRLSRAYLSRARRVLLVRIAYQGTDSCWEPGGKYHAVRLPALHD